MFLLKTILAFIMAYAITLFVLPRLSSIASKIGLLDYPDGRKVHDIPKPLVGGLGMVIGLSISSLLFIPLSNLRGFYAGMLMLTVTGFLDDFREVGHKLKFAIQVLATLIMAYFSKTVLLSFGDLLSFGPVNFGMFAVPVTIFCVVGVINALNMIDGLDGLAGGVSVIAFISFALLAYINGQTELMLMGLAFSGAVIAFLRYNWHPAKLFMGDAGSLSLGFTLAFLSIAITQKSNSIVPPMAALLILTVPIVDTLSVMTRRFIRGKNPFHADKNHLHHILMRFGLGRKTTVVTILLLSGLFSLLAVIGTIYQIPDYCLFLIFSVYFIAYFLASFFIKEAGTY